MRKVEWSTHELEQEKSELNQRIEEEQISNSRDRENLEEEWKTKLEKEKWEKNKAGRGKTETRFEIATDEEKGKIR